MRLINTSTFMFEEFIGKDIPKYAILSHTWGQDEVSLKDMTDNLSFKTKKGYRKIEMTCQIASQSGYCYAWIDTCCIDKSSSAELTEAINSMFLWYQRAEICYTFLSDLLAFASLKTSLPLCRWFTRGWTLQELVAPRHIWFFDQDWNYRGSKEDLVHELSEITHIDPAILQGERKLSATSIAQRMSWASHRETTRVEDMAYCLVGIFDVNMPLLYGEEVKAFRRLQEEIIKSSADLSIFAWRWPVETKRGIGSMDRVFCGILSESPRHFSDSGLLVKLPRQDWRDYSVSNSGIKIQAKILSLNLPKTKGISYVLPLNCSWDYKESIGVRLRMCGPDQFVREDPWEFFECSTALWPNAERLRYLLTDLPEAFDGSPEADMSSMIARTRSHALAIERPLGIWVYDAWPWSRFDDEDQLFFVTPNEALDSAGLKLSISSTILVDRQERTVDFEALFYAIGWCSLDISKIQCTLVEYQQSSGAWNEVQAEISGWAHNSSQVLEILIRQKIPKKEKALFAIPKTRSTMMVSFVLTLVEDPNICENKFWRIKFTCTVLKTSKSPTIHYKTWNRDFF